MTTTELLELTLDQVHPADDNVRTKVGDVKELAASITAVGILEPLLVTPNASGYVIVAGARRYAAAKVAGLETVPCVVRAALSDDERVEAMVIENLQREDLTPIEEGKAFARLVALDWSQRKIAERIGCNQSHVSKRLALTKLPAQALKALDAGSITLEDAVEISKYSDEPELIVTALKSGRSVTWALTGAVRDRDRAAGLQTITEQLKAKGVRIVKDEGWSPTHYALIGKSWRQLDVDKRQHAKEPCHAVLLTFNTYESVKPAAAHVCTDPKRHGPKGASELKGKIDGPSSSGKSDSQKRKERDEREASKTRREFMAGMLTASPKRADVVELVIGRYLDDAAHDEKVRMCGLLGIEPIVTEERAGTTGKDYDAPLTAFLEASDANRLRGCLAFALVQGEDRLRWGADNARAREHLQLLAGAGYEPHPSEAKRFAAAAQVAE